MVNKGIKVHFIHQLFLNIRSVTVSNPTIPHPYLSSRPGSARTCGVWIDSRKMAPPSPSIRNACAPIVTSFRFTENKFRPVVSLMRNPAARHSNLSWPKNKWFSSKPFGSRVFIEKLREDSLKVGKHLSYKNKRQTEIVKCIKHHVQFC